MDRCSALAGGDSTRHFGSSVAALCSVRVHTLTRRVASIACSNKGAALRATATRRVARSTARRGARTLAAHIRILRRGKWEK